MASDNVSEALSKIPDALSYEISTKRQPKKELDKDAFLQLFILSLKNQDPTNTQDPNEFMAQMAQFSILEQLSNMNAEMSKLRFSQELGQASGMIGREVVIHVGTVQLEGVVEKVTTYQGNVQVYLEGMDVAFDLEHVKEVQ